MGIIPDQRHTHKWISWDWPRISYNDLKDLPEATASLQVAHWVLSISATWDTSVSCGFKPKFITMQAWWAVSWWSNIRSWSHSSGSYDVANATNRSYRMDELENEHVDAWTPTAATSTTRIYALNVNTTSWWSLSNNASIKSTSSTGFVVECHNAGLTAKVVWQAWG